MNNSTAKITDMAFDAGMEFLKTPKPSTPGYRTFRARADRMLSLGFPIIPLQAKSKNPCTEHGALDATTDLAVVMGWVKKYSAASNCGAVARFDGFWILDDDLGTLAQKYKEDTGQDFPRTFAVKTSRGFHYYFIHDDASRLVRYGAHENSGVINILGYKGEARCNDQYVVSPGSVHPSGAVYTICDDAPILAAPVQLLEWLQKAYALSESVKPESDKPKGGGKSDSGFRKIFDAVGYRPLVKRINALENVALHLPDGLNRGEIVPCPMPQHKHADYTNCFGSIRNVPEMLHCLGNCQWSGDVVSACYQLDGGKAKYKTMYDAARAICKEEGLKFEDFFPPVKSAVVDKLISEQASLEVREVLRFDILESDCGNARRLLEAHGHDICYNTDQDRWFVWDGRRWAPDRKGRIVAEMMKSVMQKLRNDSLAVMNELEPIVAGLGKTPTDDEDKIKARYKKAKRDYQWSVESESDRHIGGAVRQASSESACVVVADCDMDTHLYLINLQNGTYDLKAHQLRDPRREDYLTKLAPVTYDPLAKCVRFDAFLLEIFPDNQAIIDYLQRLLGYCLCGAAIERIVPFLIGAGANGKSVICNVMLFAIFGRTSDGYGMESNFSTFTTSKYQAPDKPRNDLVRMRSKRFVTASETDDPNVKMDTALLKKISGNDGIAVRGNFQQEIEYAPQAKVFLRMNNEPRILDATDSTWDRVKKISFTRQFSEDEKDPELTNKLMTESSGIFDWLLAGWMLVHAAWTNHEAALPEPAEMRMATDEYRQGQSRVARFFAEHYGVASHECEPIPIATMYAEYGKWLEKQGEHFKDTQNQFGRELTRHLAPHKKVVKGARGHGNVMSWCGVERIDAAQQSKQEEIPF